MKVKNSNPEMSVEAGTGEQVRCPHCGADFVLFDRHSWTGYRHRVCGQRIRITNFETQVKPIWCVVGNVTGEIIFGEDKQIRQGTRHFSPGTKIYCYPPLWDLWDGHQVIGRHRGSKHFVTMCIRIKWLVNYQVKMVYEPEIIELLSEYWDETEESKKRAENLVGILDYWRDFERQK